MDICGSSANNSELGHPGPFPFFCMSSSFMTENEVQDVEERPQIPVDAEIIDLTALSDGSTDEGEETDDSGSENGSSDDEELVINEHSRAQLRAALKTVPTTRLQEILMALIEQIPAVERAMTKEFVVSRAKALKRHREEDDESEPEHVERCTKCHREYDAAVEPENGACSFHPGNMEPNRGMFVDWDEDVHGPIDCEKTRKEYPANFSWSCCEEDGVSSGCVKTVHEPVRSHNKKRRTDEG
ncbi:hypothetical protein E1B28_011647 [Marasmius oreades]|uniref:Uncharacterized protein n=1 Tax=Marasmius oreades TaxID=181124 RepID=A0A9P7RUI3_9AGAR|nr:uncharacterized protein E1B28_011647 [Marasmius oreades]KAG7090026.1 hypothetical protein E1B28_011647 [Marasmius oreades]